MGRPQRRSNSVKPDSPKRRGEPVISRVFSPLCPVAAQGFLLPLLEGPHCIVESFHRHPAAVVVQRCDETGEFGGWIGDRPPEDPGVKIDTRPR